MHELRSIATEFDVEVTLRPDGKTLFVSDGFAILVEKSSQYLVKHKDAPAVECKLIVVTSSGVYDEHYISQFVALDLRDAVIVGSQIFNNLRRVLTITLTK